MTIEEMRRRKQELGYTNEMLAEKSGVPLGTIQKIFGGSTRAPRRATIEKLENVLFENRRTEDVRYFPSGRPVPSFIREKIAAYKVPEPPGGPHTLEDYYALPDGTRVELIDGIFYDMAAPSALHQELMLILAMLLKEHVRKNHGGCKVFAAPYDVQLDCDDRTMVEPDVMVICDVKKVTMRCCFGAPDLVMEILSPATRRRDLTLKASKYQNAGVREYWVIDPKEEKLIVYDFAGDKFPAIYNFTMQVPVGIWNGELQIDFRKIREELAYLYDAGDTEEE